MTISKGQDWGREVARPETLRLASDDAQLAAWLDDDTGQPTAAAAGDVFTTIGARPVAERDTLLALPIDLVDVVLDEERAATAVAHVVVRRRWTAGGAWRGRVVAVMNAEYHRQRSVIARGHPNDGRVEVVEADPALTVRQRSAVRRRLRSGTHLPHPLLSTRSVRSASWQFERPHVVVVDGRVIGSARRVDMCVRADAALVYG
jgi:hypothetical protein